MSLLLFTGMPGSGKSSELASITMKLLRRNKKFYEKQVKSYERNLKKGVVGVPPVPRVVWSNVLLRDDLSAAWSGYIAYYHNLLELTAKRDIDIVCQEMSQYIDSQEWEKLSREFKSFMRKHRHYGIDLYGDTQDFMTVDLNFRRLVNKVYYCQKLIGTRDISATRPRVDFVFVLVMLRKVDPSSFDKEKELYRFVPFSWQFRILTKASTSIYDTRQDVPMPNYSLLQHNIRKCNVCGKEMIVHG